MSTLQSLLAVYGHIDDQVRAQPERRVPIAARYLPNFADEAGGPGWYDEIKAFAEAHRREGVETVEWPTFDEAVEELVSSELTSSQLGKLVFAVGVLAHLSEEGADVSQETLTRALLPATTASQSDQTGDLLDMLASDRFLSREQWPELVAGAIEQGVMTAELALTAAPCTGQYVTFGNELVTRLETNFTDPNAVLDQVKAVLDPLNWDPCSEFFCSMTALAPNTAGWSQVLEEIGFPCELWSFRTGLKYWKVNLPDGALVNYDLCDTRPAGDDGVVSVDNGWIEVREVPGGGVRVNTVKQLAFTGFLSGTAVAIVACVLGWADAGQDLIFGCANKQSGTTAWAPSGDASTANAPPGNAPRMAQRVSTPGGAPIGSTGAMVDDAVNLMTTCIKEMAAKNAAWLQKAESGQMKADDLVGMWAEMTARMFVEPARLWARMYARPQPTPPADPTPSEGETR